MRARTSLIAATRIARRVAVVGDRSDLKLGVACEGAERLFLVAIPNGGVPLARILADNLELELPESYGGND